MLIAKSWRMLGLTILAALGLLALGGTMKAAHAQTPPGTEESLGARLYSENCAVCHGANGEGRIGAQLAKNWPSIRPDLTVKTIIENGVPNTAMPAWIQAKGGPLTSQEIDAIVAFILSWQSGGAPQITALPRATSRPPITPLPDVVGDPNQGALLYDQNCAVCHGANGEGRIGATLAKHWPALRPDLTIQSTIRNGVPNTAMPAWGQANGGPLAESEINDLVAFLLTWQDNPAVVQVSPTVISPISETPSPLSGWAGVILAVSGLAILIAFALLLQKKK